MFANPSAEALKSLLAEARTIAMVGASSKPNRPSYGVMRRLLAHVYHVIPVNPNEQEVLGEPAVAHLADIKEHIDIVDVFRRAEDTPPIADEAVSIGADVFWLQQGIINEDAADRAQRAGLTVVMDRCLAVDLSMLEIPRKP